MIKKFLSLLFCLAFAAGKIYAIELQECEVRGVKPSDKISTLELNPAMTVIDDSAGTSITSMTLKYYYSFSNMFTIGTEVPFSRYESKENSENGLGDILLSASAVKRFGKLAFGAVGELTMPSATHNEIGIGKWQFSPAVYTEYEIVPQVFFAAGYKHYVSIAGPSSRDDINLGRIRAVAAYLSPHGWWALVDPKYYIDYKNNNAGEFIIEVETGIMLFDEMSMYLKPGWHAGGNRQTMDWSVSFGVKLLSV
ncbi:MAG: hypothetical protein ACI352_00825 [Elusimicrobiaceae bacterium]|nr:hypothetical protein [Elusimicrobiota bacterium]